METVDEKHKNNIEEIKQIPISIESMLGFHLPEPQKQMDPIQKWAKD